jgi:hypothetical protein
LATIKKEIRLRVEKTVYCVAMRTKTERANKATIGTVNEKTRKNSST